MLRKITAIISLLLVLTLLLCACGEVPTPDNTNDDQVNNDLPNDDPADEPADDPADEPADDPADDPADEPSDEPTDDPAETTDPEKYPKDRKVKNILMIGNSHCYY